MRQNDLAWEVRDYLKTHPKAVVVNLGCGLDQTGRNCDNGNCGVISRWMIQILRGFTDFSQRLAMDR